MLVQLYSEEELPETAVKARKITIHDGNHYSFIARSLKPKAKLYDNLI